MIAEASVFVPATVGNLGPGFDVLGAALEGPGDIITVSLTDQSHDEVVSVTGRDAALIPRDPKSNCSVVAALSALNKLRDPRRVKISIHRELPVAGGLGSSAAASVGGALAAMYAAQKDLTQEQILSAALDGEESVSGKHLDNIAPCLLGGVTLVYQIDPPRVTRLALKGEWWMTIVSPEIQLSTKKARHVLPTLVSQQDFVQQMAHTAGLVAALTSGNYALAKETLIDIYAEPRRAPLINGFTEAKKVALAEGAIGCSISGAGPSIFALCSDQVSSERVGKEMVKVLNPIPSTYRVGKIANEGARRV